MSGIEAEGLEKRFGERTAVTGMGFSVAAGEVFGLLGPNGAGKTTTVRMLTGLLTPSAGRASVFGVDVATGGDALRRSVGLLTEQPGLYDRLTGRENLRFFMKLNEVDERTAWPRAQAYLERFGLAGREDEPCGGYSKGMRQKLAIIRALVHEPKVIFLDEPTSGLDPEAARTVRDAVAELAEEGRTIVLCSHNLAEVERLCRRVAVVKGRLLAQGPISELRREGSALELQVEGEAGLHEASVRAVPAVDGVLCEGGRMRVMLRDPAAGADVISALVHGGARVQSAVRTGRPLEEIYLELVQGRAVAPAGD